MTSAEIRQSFHDFFASKGHTIVPSASLLPQSPGLLFTNAGMNQFVPYFLGTEPAPYDPPRAADTQKCIRAGGKHNDLEDVGRDSYHHTFFEMLGNWSFGDYFKKEAIEWAWELLVERWGVPPERLYATVYSPGEGEPAEFDEEAAERWGALFCAVGLDPQKHVLTGGAKDNFWMMGDTGPCGPCSELHLDLTPNGDTGGKLVNADSDQCIEIWNLVFMAYNAEADGSLRPLPAQHVDTGMGFERICSAIQNTAGFTHFPARLSNYQTDLFTPLFEAIGQASGESYRDLYSREEGGSERELEVATAFRVIADHLRTLSFSIADGILPGNTGRNYVLRRILRRAVKYGRSLGFHGGEPFLPKLVEPLIEVMGEAFPELVRRREAIEETLRLEEESFNQTLDRGLSLFGKVAAELEKGGSFPPAEAFKLYDTFGFPLDLTALLCRERGLVLDEGAVEALMEEARERSRGAQQREVVRAAEISSEVQTVFVGEEEGQCQARVMEVGEVDGQAYFITDQTVFYTEMGGQEGDCGWVRAREGARHEVRATFQAGAAVGHLLMGPQPFEVGEEVVLEIDEERRRPISAHHTATHLLHWALHQEVSAEITQQGSAVGPQRLRFDFNSEALDAEQLAAVERRVQQAIAANDPVSWTQRPHQEIADRADIMQFFGDKYGAEVRIVQIGGQPEHLNGYSMELCGGTHLSTTGQIEHFRIRREEAVAKGIRRIEALCGAAAREWEAEEREAEERERAEWRQKWRELEGEEGFADLQLTPPAAEASSAQWQEALAQARKQWTKRQQAQAAQAARAALEELLASHQGSLVESFSGEAALLAELLNALKARQFGAAAFLVVDDGQKLHLGAYAGAEALAEGVKAGALLGKVAQVAGGKGGGRPEMARGAAPQRDKLAELLQFAQEELA